MSLPIAGPSLDPTASPSAAAPTPALVFVPAPVPTPVPTPTLAYKVDLSTAAQAHGLDVSGESGAEVAAILGAI